MTNIAMNIEQEPAAPTQPASKLYKLDWATTVVQMNGGKFTHELRRPSAEQIFDRDKSLQSEIPIDKDGGYQLPDPTATEDVDAELYDKILVKCEGYPSEVPAMHKSQAFQALYAREIELSEDASFLDAELQIVEEIGSGDYPDFTLIHVLRQPKEDELRKYRQRSTSGTIKPGKRGRQIFVTKSSLRPAVTFYDQLFVSIDGAEIGGQPYAADRRAEFLATIDPLIKLKVVSELVGGLSGKLQD